MTVCVIEGCGTTPKSAPLCSKHARYAKPEGPERVPVSEAGWTWVMEQAAAAKSTGDSPDTFARRVLRGYPLVSRADTHALLDVPGWALHRLDAPWVPSELILSLAEHDRPVADRVAVASWVNDHIGPAEVYELLARDPDGEVRLAAALGWLPDVARNILMHDADDAVFAAATGMTNPHFTYAHELPGQWTSPALLNREQANRVASLVDMNDDERFTRLLDADVVPSWQGMTLTGFRGPEAAGYIAFHAPNRNVRDTALAMLSEWHGTLPDLLAAAAAV